MPTSRVTVTSTALHTGADVVPRALDERRGDGGLHRAAGVPAIREADHAGRRWAVRHCASAAPMPTPPTGTARSRRSCPSTSRRPYDRVTLNDAGSSRWPDVVTQTGSKVILNVNAAAHDPQMALNLVEAAERVLPAGQPERRRDRQRAEPVLRRLRRHQPQTTRPGSRTSTRSATTRSTRCTRTLLQRHCRIADARRP